MPLSIRFTFCPPARKGGIALLFLAGLLGIVLSNFTVRGAIPPEYLVNTAIKSHSGQFTVQAVPKPNLTNAHPKRVSVAGGWAFLMAPPLAASSDNTAQTLDPALLVTSCERVKHAILRELNLPDRWRGPIDLNINRSRRERSEPILRMTPIPTGWRYELDLPSSMKPQQLARALVGIVLLEMANRSAVEGQSTQVPLWLVEGMMAQINASDYTVLLRPNMTTASSTLLENQKKPLLLLASSVTSIQDPAILARLQRLGSRPSLTFQELSWPTQEQISGNDEEFYQACSHLFLYQLLNLKDGRVALCRFLERLPEHLNWQLSFVEAYSFQFAQLRDVEKWWGLVQVNGAGTDARRWSAEESAHRFRDALEVPIQVRSKTADMPAAGKTTLQDVVLHWDKANQTPALQKVCADLVTLRPMVTPEYLPIVDRYCRTIESFLKRSSPAALSWMRTEGAPRRAREAAAKQLQEADKLLAELMSPAKPTPTKEVGQTAAK